MSDLVRGKSGGGSLGGLEKAHGLGELRGEELPSEPSVTRPIPPPRCPSSNGGGGCTGPGKPVDHISHEKLSLDNVGRQGPSGKNYTRCPLNGGCWLRSENFRPWENLPVLYNSVAVKPPPQI